MEGKLFCNIVQTISEKVVPGLLDKRHQLYSSGTCNIIFVSCRHLLCNGTIYVVYKT